MPLININNTTDPKIIGSPLPNFVTPPANYSSNVAVTNTNSDDDVKEYSGPVQEPQVEEAKDIKDSLENKLSNIPDLEADSVQNLPPLVNNPAEVADLQAKIPNVANETLEINVPQSPTTLPELEASMKLEVPQIQNTEAEPIQAKERLITEIPQINPPAEAKVEKAKPMVDTNGRHLELSEILDIGIKQKASDIHLTPGYRTMIRVDGKLELASSTVLTEDIVNKYVQELLKNRQEIKIENINEVDLTYTWNDRRFRVNIFKQTGNFSIALRIIPEKILSIAELGMPEGINQFADFPNGLVLVTGPTGSGKSTTIAAILNQINLTQPKHIVTLEDPIEFVFPKGMGLVDQREFGIDFTSWDNALRSVLRQDPDVVLVGEMRDLETVEAALQIAETGHLVFATLHTNGASETINRVIDIFDSQKQDQIRVQLSSVLRAVISQKLVPLPSGGRKPAVEILLSTPSVRNAVREKKTFQIDNIIQTSSDTGMISMEKSLVLMVKQGLISKDQAKSLSVNPNEIDILLQQ